MNGFLPQEEPEKKRDAKRARYRQSSRAPKGPHRRTRVYRLNQTPPPVKRSPGGEAVVSCERIQCQRKC